MRFSVYKSKKLYEKYSNMIGTKMCYQNIFRISVLELEKFNSGKWKIAYGYVSIYEDSLFARHCFIIDSDNIIDPTIFVTGEVKENPEYMVFKVFDDYNDYYTMIEKNDFKPDLIYPLRELDYKLVKEMLEQNKYLIT